MLPFCEVYRLSVIYPLSLHTHTHTPVRLDHVISSNTIILTLSPLSWSTWTATEKSRTPALATGAGHAQERVVLKSNTDTRVVQKEWQNRSSQYVPLKLDLLPGNAPADTGKVLTRNISSAVSDGGGGALVHKFQGHALLYLGPWLQTRYLCCVQQAINISHWEISLQFRIVSKYKWFSSHFLRLNENSYCFLWMHREFLLHAYPPPPVSTTLSWFFWLECTLVLNPHFSIFETQWMEQYLLCFLCLQRLLMCLTSHCFYS